jgi:hypothetical protein
MGTGKLNLLNHIPQLNANADKKRGDEKIRYFNL